MQEYCLVKNIVHAQFSPKLLYRALLIMKIIIIIMLAAILQVSARGYGQGITLKESNASMSQVLKKIEKQSSYMFWYTDEIISKARRVNVDVNNVSITEALAIVFKDQPLTFTILEKAVVIKEKPKAVEVSGIMTPEADPIDIKGKVVNERGVPVEGVTVTVKNTNISTNTDLNGEFSLIGVDGDAWLEFTHVSMGKVEKRVGREMVVVMESISEDLKGVEVVWTGFENVTKSRSTAATAKIDSALYHRAVGTDILSRMDGITNGIMFDKRGALHIQIRGLSTIMGDLNPLIILDNFPFNGNIRNINPNDIAEITILKDAAAASMWGSNNAGNGVIVIKTKKANYNQGLAISFNSNVTIQEKPNLFYFPEMSSSDFIDVEQFLFDKGFYNAQINNQHIAVISPVVDILNQRRLGNISQEQAESQINILRTQDLRNDFKDYVFRNALLQQHFVNIQSGTEKFSYKLSLGYDNNLSQIKGPGGFDRVTINTNVGFKPSKFVELSIGVNLSQSNAKQDGLSYPIAPKGVNAGFSKAEIYPYARIADDDGRPLVIPYGYGKAYVDTVGAGKLLDWRYRPLDEMYLANSGTKTHYALLNFGMNFKFTNWLNAEVRYQYSSQLAIAKDIKSVETFFARDLINKFTQKGTYQQIVPMGGIVDQNEGSLTTQYFRAQLNFKKTGNSQHLFSALLAFEIGNTEAEASAIRLYGYDPDYSSVANNVDYVSSFPTLPTGISMIPNNVSISKQENRNLGIVGNASYTYKSRYTLYASARKDGSNIFGVKTNNKWKPLWATGISWEVSKEPFYRIKWLPGARLRLSYGYTGNINNRTPAITTVRYTINNSFLGTPYAIINSAPNPDLRWEEVRIANIGLDFVLFGNLIHGSVDLFHKKSLDVIAAFPVDPTLGISGNIINKNAATLEGNGLEVSLNSRHSINKDLSLSSTINFSRAKMIVSDYFQNQVLGIHTPGGINPQAGQIAWGIYAYRWAGLDPENGDPRGFLNKEVSKDYVSIMTDSFANHAFIGSALPLYFGNFLTTISWKQLSISVNIGFRFEYYFQKASINYSGLFKNWVGHSEYSQRWQNPGDEKETNVPSMSYPANSNRDIFYANSEVNIEKGDHIRLRDLRISYDLSLKKRWLKFIHIAQIYAYANNLNTMIWKASNTQYDPDYSTSGLPPSRSYSIGINISFK